MVVVLIVVVDLCLFIILGKVCYGLLGLKVLSVSGFFGEVWLVVYCSFSIFVIGCVLMF